MSLISWKFPSRLLNKQIISSFCAKLAFFEDYCGSTRTSFLGGGGADTGYFWWWTVLVWTIWSCQMWPLYCSFTNFMKRLAATFTSSPQKQNSTKFQNRPLMSLQKSFMDLYLFPLRFFSMDMASIFRFETIRSKSQQQDGLWSKLTRKGTMSGSAFKVMRKFWHFCLSFACISIINIILVRVEVLVCLRFRFDGSLSLALLSLALGGLDSDFLVVLLEGGEVLSGLGELSLLHTLSDVPVDEGSLGVHEVELVVESGEDLGDGGGVGDHAHGSHDLGEVTSGHDGGGLVVDADLEPGGAPVHELDRPLGLDGGDGGVDVLGHDVASVHHGAGHVLAVAGVALGHHVGGLEGRVGDLGHRQLLVVGLLGGDDGGVGRQHEVDTGVGHQVGLELGDVHVQGTVEPQRGGQRRDDLGDQPVQVGVGGPLDVEVPPADVVHGLVVEHDGDVGVLQQRVGRQDRVVGLDHGGGDLGRRVDGEAQLRLLAVVDGQPLQQEGAQTGPGSSSDGVEHEEALQTGAVVGQLSDSVEAQVDDFLADGVVASGEVVGGVLLAGDQLLGVEQLPVGAGSDLVNDGGLEVEEDGSGDVLAGTSLREEGVEGVVAATDGLVRWHLAIRLDAVLEAEQLPAGVTDLDTSLSDVDRDDFSHSQFLMELILASPPWPHHLNPDTYSVTFFKFEWKIGKMK